MRASELPLSTPGKLATTSLDLDVEEELEKNALEEEVANHTRILARQSTKQFPKWTGERETQARAGRAIFFTSDSFLD